MTKDGGERLLERTPTDISESSPAPAPELDPARYLPHFTDVDLSDEKKQEFLQTIWQIMCRLVELGFEADFLSASL